LLFREYGVAALKYLSKRIPAVWLRKGVFY